MGSHSLILSDEELYNASNRYSELLSSFVSVCKFLELQANNKKKVVDLENETTFAKHTRAVANLSNCIDNINLACNKLRTMNICIDRKNLFDCDGYLEIPYAMQSETVQSFKDVYNPFEDSEKRVKNVDLLKSTEDAAVLIRTVKSNISELQNFQILHLFN